MHISINRNKTKNRKSIYNSVLLRESYRKDGKVLKRTIANLSKCAPEEIEAMQLALKHKDNLAALTNLKSVSLKQDASVGAVWVIAQVAKTLGIDRALGDDFHGQLALWQICARVIGQGSRLSAVRLAQVHAACDVIGIRRGFDENDLYENLGWLAEHQETIEKSLFEFRHGKKKPTLFLYDVTSSYLEGMCNSLGARGYNRDKKKGKLQIVIGLLCDDEGNPVAVEVFEGNTQDPKTVASQVEKLAQRFDCTDVTLVGDRGMIKSAQINELPDTFHYITAITKPQMTTLIEKDIIQLELFQETLCEVTDNDIRYVLRKNPIRAKEISDNKESKERYIQRLITKKNEYLKAHPKASVAVAKNDIIKRINQLKISGWCMLRKVHSKRELAITIDQDQRNQDSLLDGCYVIKTDLVAKTASKEIVHSRYKDLAQVEKAFRYCKTALLEVRPVYVRTESHTRGHVLVVMLSYMILRQLQEAWMRFDLTAEEGVEQLAMLSATKLTINGKGECLRIPTPNDANQALLDALKLSIPPVLPHKDVNVVTRKKLLSRRKKLNP